MKKLNKFLIKIFIALLFIILSIVGFFYIFNSIKSKNDNTTNLLTQAQDESDRRNNIEKLNVQIKAIAPQRKMLETHFAKSSDVVTFLDNLQNLGKLAKAPVEIFSVDLDKDNSLLKVQMSAKGSFIAIHNLFYLLQNSQYELDFSAVNLQTTTGSSDSTKNVSNIQQWQANFSLTLLSFNF
ncbi:MAG: hypothetical protein NTZ44_00405 [Candidatus Nomurabacteria bacterium]|nr:hypothetical protein [Candidatus Nomurabacteria bacterium]